MPHSELDNKIGRTLWATGFVAHRFVTEYMARLTRDTDIDNQHAILWGLVFSLGFARQYHPHQFDPATLDENGAGVAPLHPVRLADLTQISGIPKETCRRKLNYLAQSGRLRKNPDSSWTAIPSPLDDPVRAESIRNIRNLLLAAREIEAILAKV